LFIPKKDEYKLTKEEKEFALRRYKENKYKPFVRIKKNPTELISEEEL
jgi:hypothetical protein